MSKTGGIIAAASKKVAQPLLQIGTISIIRRIVITYQQAGIFPVVIITGANEAEVKRQLSSYGVIFVHNEDSEEPELFSSVKLGLKYLEGKCERVMFTPVNVPMFTPTTLLSMMEHGEDIVTPSYKGKAGHPVLISSNAIPCILDYSGDKGLYGAISACSGSRALAEVDDKGVLLNVHNVDELKTLLDKHNAAILHPVVHMCMERESVFLNERLKLILFMLLGGHSIRSSCAATGLSYSKAWDMINQLEHSLGYAVVGRQRGGIGGGGTSLTPEGVRFLTAYQEFEEAIHKISQDEFRERFIDTKIVNNL